MNRIIKSFLDFDFYKLTMGQLFFEQFKVNQLIIEYSFKNRSKYMLNKIPIEVINEQFRYLSELRASQSDVDFIKSKYPEVFSDEYFDFIMNIQLPIITVGDNYSIVYSGDVRTHIYMETYILSIINELYYIYNTDAYSNLKKVTEFGLSKVVESFRKINAVPDFPTKAITEFGTRRRFSFSYQREVLNIIRNYEYIFGGTSNVHLAKEFDLKPIGTNAHELYMIYAGLIGLDNDVTLRESQFEVLDLWEERYPYDMRIALSDTFGTNVFLEDFKKYKNDWKGLRHDSGDALLFGERCIDFFGASLSKEKLILFSDGLNTEEILRIHYRFVNRIKYGYGWGTMLTNNLGMETLSIVVKPSKIISYNGVVVDRPLVKLSDNLNKNTGNLLEIERYKIVFDYVNKQSSELIV